MPLYPEIKTVKTYSVKVDLSHTLYVEECGNPDGIPVIFLHGGPGSGCNESHRSYFNPEKYRIVLFDQRGCGRSIPHGCLDNNTTHHLVDDIETIRQQLGIEKWVIFAGSWGVTLALLYAQRYPDKTIELILRGSFLASKRDLDWFFSEGVNRLYPELWEAMNTNLEKLNDSETLLEIFHRCINSDDLVLNQKAAKAWSDWTDTIVTWTLDSQATDEKSDSESTNSHKEIANKDVSNKDITNKQIRSIRLEIHYAINKYFLKENHLLDNITSIRHIPTQLIHGRKDITCPVESSWRLHQNLTHSSLLILPNAGHLAGEPDLIEALVNATDKIVNRLS